MSNLTVSATSNTTSALIATSDPPSISEAYTTSTSTSKAETTHTSTSKAETTPTNTSKAYDASSTTGKPTSTAAKTTKTQPKITATPSAPVFGTCKASIPATCKPYSLGSHTSKHTASTWYITKQTVGSSTYVTTYTSGGSLVTATSTVPIMSTETIAYGAGPNTTGLVNNAQFNSAITNASIDHSGLGLMLFVIYIFHFLFRL